MHGGLAVAIAHIETKESRAATAIEIAETKKREPEKKPPAEVKPDLPPESKKLARRSVAAAAPKPAEAPPPVAAQPTLDSVPDFGLELSGGVVSRIADFGHITWLLDAADSVVLW